MTKFRTAHGAAAKGGATKVVEVPPVDELMPVSVAETEKNLAVRKSRGRPFEKGNKAGGPRTPSLARIQQNPLLPEVALSPEQRAELILAERRKMMRKANSLKNRFCREALVMYGGFSVAVEVQIKFWAQMTSLTDFHINIGDYDTAMKAAKEASQHITKAYAMADHERRAVQGTLKDEDNPFYKAIEKLAAKQREINEVSGVPIPEDEGGGEKEDA